MCVRTCVCVCVCVCVYVCVLGEMKGGRAKLKKEGKQQDNQNHTQTLMHTNYVDAFLKACFWYGTKINAQNNVSKKN